MNRRRWIIAIALGLVALAALAIAWDDLVEKRVHVIEAGKIFRGAWQRPRPLRRLIKREHIRTIITLTAINADDPKYVDQKNILRGTDVGWVLIPMKGSRATLEQMASAADLVADPSRQPVFFHCVGGHHRSSLVQAAYRIKHEGWTFEAAWNEVAALPWARPDSAADASDRDLIQAFAQVYGRSPRKDSHDQASIHSLVLPRPDADVGDGGRVRAFALGRR